MMYKIRTGRKFYENDPGKKIVGHSKLTFFFEVMMNMNDVKLVVIWSFCIQSILISFNVGVIRWTCIIPFGLSTLVLGVTSVVPLFSTVLVVVGVTVFSNFSLTI